MELHHSRTQRLTMVRRSIQSDNGLHQRLSRPPTQMHVQACTPAPEHLSLRDSMPLDLERWRRLEAKHHSETDFVGNSEAFERWTKYWKPSPTRAPEHVQEWQKEIPWNCQSLCSQMQNSGKMRNQVRKNESTTLEVKINWFVWTL